MKKITWGAEKIEMMRERIERDITCPISGEVLNLNTAVSVWSAIDGRLVTVVAPGVMTTMKRQILQGRGQAVRTMQDFKKKAA